MGSSSFWHRSARTLCAVIAAALLVPFFSCHADAQFLPSLGSPGDLLGNFFSSLSPSRIEATNFKFGVYWGGGQMSVTHNINPGPTPGGAYLPGLPGPLSPGFEHRRDTDLQDTFFSFEWRARRGNVDFASLYGDFSVGRRNQFKQTTSGSSGNAFLAGRGTGRPTLAVLWLPDDLEGIITLDNKNKMYNLDLSFAFPLAPGLQFLAGWKYGQIRSDLDPYTAAVPDGSFAQLPGIIAWQNLFTVFGAPSTTGFTITQSMWWSGPFIGLRLAERVPQNLPAQWYVDFKYVPYAWGTYRFEWDGSFSALGFFVNGQQVTNATGLRRYLLEVKGGTQVNLTERLFLDVWGKYCYLKMNGSVPELQAFNNNVGFAPPAVPSLSQEADQTVSMNINFWGVGGDLILPF